MHELGTNQQYWFDYDASRRGTLLLTRTNNSIAIVAEPSPDVALELLTKLKATATSGNIQGGGEAELNSRIIELTKRSQTILFLREALYRLSEMSVNYNVSSDVVTNLYGEVLKAALTLAQAELAADQAKAKMAEAELKEQERKLTEERTRQMVVEDRIKKGTAREIDEFFKQGTNTTPNPK
jgi:hypothetical protein